MNLQHLVTAAARWLAAFDAPALRTALQAQLPGLTPGLAPALPPGLPAPGRRAASPTVPGAAA